MTHSAGGRHNRSSAGLAGGLSSQLRGVSRAVIVKLLALGRQQVFGHGPQQARENFFFLTVFNFFGSARRRTREFAPFEKLRNKSNKGWPYA